MNFLIICVDALRADHLGCYAGTDRGTPHMDRLAAGGVRFANAVSQASWTHPSVASIMTGLYPSQHVMGGPRPGGEGTKLTALHPDLPTLAGCLGGAGFATAAFVAGNAYLKPEFGITAGFGHVEFRTTTDGAAVVDDFEAWLGEAGDGPWAAYVHLMDVHSPLPAEFFPTRPLVDRGVDAAVVDAGPETLLSYYAAGVRRADAHIGRLLAFLEAAGRGEDTWVVLTADHGEELNEHGVMLSHGQSLYRQLVWVPLVVRRSDGVGAGNTPAPPVSHIDLLPTLLEVAGVPVPDVPGCSLLPWLGAGAGPAANGEVAFSELLKRVRYSRSVTTAEHHFIETFHVSKAPPARLSDLTPGTPLEIKGQAVGGGFLPTKVTIGIPGPDKLLGLVERVDPSDGAVTVLGFDFTVDATTDLVGLDKGPFPLAELVPGDRINVILDPPGPSGGGRRARSVMWRKPGGESKLEGPAESVVDAGGGAVTVVVMGRPVRIDPTQTRLVHRHDSSRKWQREEVLAMVRAGQYVARERELYRHVADPAESENLVDAEPDLAAALERRLDAWAERTASFQAPGALVELDPETEAQLRKLGYLA